MREWRRYSIRQLVGAPISGKRPTGGVNAESEGIPSLGGENIRAEGGMDYGTINRIPVEFFQSMPKGRIQANDVLINKDGAQTGKVGLYDGRLGEAAVNEHVFILRSSSGAIDQKLLYYFLLLPDTQLRIATRITGSAQPGLNSQFADAVHLTVPSERGEQCRIAEILSTVDEAIEQTEALIAKTQQIKAGLMHDLFTRGVTADGQLRPPREKAPQLYKESPLGWIPREWELTNLGTMAEIASGVTLNGDIGSGHIEVPYLRVANVQDGYLDLDDIKTIRVTASQLLKLALRRGDVLMNEGGDFDKLGRGTIWNQEIDPCVHQNHVFRVRPRSEMLRSQFLAYWSQSTFGKKYFVLSSKQSTNLASINSTQLHKFPVVRPDVEEQRRIEDRLETADGQLFALQNEQAKLGQLKAGAMHDLLTGRVSVSLNSASEPKEVAASV